MFEVFLVRITEDNNNCMILCKQVENVNLKSDATSGFIKSGRCKCKLSICVNLTVFT